MWCDIYLLQLSLHPVAVFGKSVHKYKINNYIKGRNNTQNNIDEQNTQNRKQTYKNRK